MITFRRMEQEKADSGLRQEEKEPLGDKVILRQKRGLQRMAVRSRVRAVAAVVLFTGIALAQPAPVLAADSSEIEAVTIGEEGNYTYDGSFTWPAPQSTGISSEYGYRVHPIYGKTKFHSGLDIASPEGSPILAAAGGTVIDTGYDSERGNYCTLDDGNGMQTIYMHASRIECTEGEHVKEGQEIAKVGETGAATGPHLHFTVKINGQCVNPHNYLGH